MKQIAAYQTIQVDGFKDGDFMRLLMISDAISGKPFLHPLSPIKTLTFYTSHHTCTRPESRTVCYSCSDKICRWNRIGWEALCIWEHREWHSSENLFWKSKEARSCYIRNLPHCPVTHDPNETRDGTHLICV